MLLQTNSYIVPKDRRAEHARLLRRFRQTLARLGCDQFECYEQVGQNWSSEQTSGRFVQIMRFRDRAHQLAVQAGERNDPAAQQLIGEFCELINFPYQQQHGLFAVGFYTGIMPSATARHEAPQAEEQTSGETEFASAQAAAAALAVVAEVPPPDQQTYAAAPAGSQQTAVDQQAEDASPFADAPAHGAELHPVPLDEEPGLVAHPEAELPESHETVPHDHLEPGLASEVPEPHAPQDSGAMVEAFDAHEHDRAITEHAVSSEDEHAAHDNGELPADAGAGNHEHEAGHPLPGPRECLDDLLVEHFGPHSNEGNEPASHPSTSGSGIGEVLDASLGDPELDVPLPAELIEPDQELLPHPNNNSHGHDHD